MVLQALLATVVVEGKVVDADALGPKEKRAGGDAQDKKANVVLVEIQAAVDLKAVEATEAIEAPRDRLAIKARKVYKDCKVRSASREILAHRDLLAPLVCKGPAEIREIRGRRVFLPVVLNTARQGYSYWCQVKISNSFGRLGGGFTRTSLWSSREMLTL